VQLVDFNNLADDELLTTRQLEALLKIGSSTRKRLDGRGDGPAVTRISPRRIGYRVRTVRQWLAAREQGHA
jgi:predicted DNA-binding transcriptional regulator AlpA